MSDAIYVSYDPFAMESSISIYKDGKQERLSVHSNVSDLADDILQIAYSKDIYEVKTHAPFAFTSEIAKAVHEVEQSQYSAKKITIGGL